jgi:hypothetical protein
MADVLAHWVTWVAGAFIAELCVRRRRQSGGGWLLIASGLAAGGCMVAQTGTEMNVVDLGWSLALGGLLAGTMLVSPSRTFGRGIESVAHRLAPAAVDPWFSTGWSRADDRGRERCDGPGRVCLVRV